MCDFVRSTCAAVVAAAKHVTINDAALETFAAGLVRCRDGVCSGDLHTGFTAIGPNVAVIDVGCAWLALRC
jgi:hypothetical protein